MDNRRKFTCHSPCGECGLKYRFCRVVMHRKRSLPMRGVWIEMLHQYHRNNCAGGHSPCGECGLKSSICSAAIPAARSLPMRGVWIEINEPVNAHTQDIGHSPCGECGLKLNGSYLGGYAPGHSPCGECGLKSRINIIKTTKNRSLPMRGVWIEIERIIPWRLCSRSLPMRGVWIEIPYKPTM